MGGQESKQSRLAHPGEDYHAGASAHGPGPYKSDQKQKVRQHEPQTNGGTPEKSIPRAIPCSPITGSQILGIALIAAVVLMGIQSVLVSFFTEENFWKTSWVIASIFMGPAVLRWPSIFDLAAITSALTALYPVSLLVILVVAGATNPLNMKWVIPVGLVLGLGFYFVDCYGLLHWFPWLTRQHSWMMLVSHVAFGGVAAWLVERARRSFG